jgi:hypothetical protein
MTSLPATIARGYQVASGANASPRFPGGTLRMQLPFFAALGLDLSRYHLGHAESLHRSRPLSGDETAAYLPECEVASHRAAS